MKSQQANSAARRVMAAAYGLGCLILAGIAIAQSLDVSRLSGPESSLIVVGNNHQCCIKSRYTSCKAKAPIACSTGAVSCDPGAPVKGQCSDAKCNSGTTSQNCDTNSTATVNVEQCTPSGTKPDSCAGGQQCPYSYTEATTENGLTVLFSSCGSSSLCSAGQPTSTCDGI